MPSTFFKPATMVFALLAACALSTLSVQPAAAQSGQTLTERFITDLERKAIDRYLNRQGMERTLRDCLLFPDRHCDFFGEGDPDEETQGKKKKRGKDSKGATQGRGKNKVPPGLAKRRELPPGLSKRRKLPPGLAARRLPKDLGIALPGRGDGTGLYEIDGHLVLMDTATDTVLDIIEGVLWGGD